MSKIRREWIVCYQGIVNTRKIGKCENGIYVRPNSSKIERVTSCSWSSSCIWSAASIAWRTLESIYYIAGNGEYTFFLLDSWSCPASKYSSITKYAFSKLKMISNSHTDPKYLSKISTYRWITSNTWKNVSFFSTSLVIYLEFVFILIDSAAKVQGCISFVNNFHAHKIDEIRHFGLSLEDRVHNVSWYLLSLLI